MLATLAMMIYQIYAPKNLQTEKTLPNFQRCIIYDSGHHYSHQM